MASFNEVVRKKKRETHTHVCPYCRREWYHHAPGCQYGYNVEHAPCPSVDCTLKHLEATTGFGPARHV